MKPAQCGYESELILPFEPPSMDHELPSLLFLAPSLGFS